MVNGCCWASPTETNTSGRYDLSAGTLTQLTFEAANRAPIWSPDGQRAIFASNRNGALNLFALPASGNGSTQRLTTSESLQLPGSWSPDGNVLAFMEQHPSTGRDIWLLQRNGDRTSFLNSEADESAPRFSPDGRWIAYVSNESGQAEVYVRAVNARLSNRISSQGGSEPVWALDGGILYYRSYGKLLASQMSGGSSAWEPCCKHHRRGTRHLRRRRLRRDERQSFPDDHRPTAWHHGSGDADHSELDADFYFFTLAVYCCPTGPIASLRALIISSTVATDGS